MRRREDARLLTGGGRALPTTRISRQGYACMVRSPRANALIAGIELRMPKLPQTSPATAQTAASGSLSTAAMSSRCRTRECLAAALAGPAKGRVADRILRPHSDFRRRQAQAGQIKLAVLGVP
jgi:hypothetical protein